MDNNKHPGINVDILIVRENGDVLLGLLSDKWLYEGKNVWGVSGRDIAFGESFGDAAKRFIAEDLECTMTDHEVICVNANDAWDGHYVGIGIVAHINGEVQKRRPEDWVRWEWFNLDAIPENLFPAAAHLIRCYKEKKMCVSE